MISYETRIGKITLSNSYFSKLIGRAVTSCFGVVGMVPHGGKQRFLGLVSKKDRLDTGVLVRGDLNSITVDLHIVVTYGMNINAIAKSIMHKVKYVVYEATGIKVSKVRIRVDGIKE
jgi:uncharacterized alkaline shock family protein YloU